MVVTTKRLSDQHHNPLRQFSQQSGIAYFFIDAQGNEDSFIAALCAYTLEMTARHLKKYFTDQNEADNFSSYPQSLIDTPEVAGNVKKQARTVHWISVKKVKSSYSVMIQW